VRKDSLPLLRRESQSRVDFNNILRKTFTNADPKSAKDTDDLTVIFTLLGSAQVKAACKMLVKSTKDLLGTKLSSMSCCQV